MSNRQGNRQQSSQIHVPNPEPMGGPGARKRSAGSTARPDTGRPNRNRPTISLDPTRPSTPATAEAVKASAERARQRQAWGGHDGMCLNTYVQAHTLEIATGKGDQREVHQILAPTREQTPLYCHCVCMRCFDRLLARCVCRVCPCTRDQDALAGYSAATQITQITQITQRNRYMPQVGFTPDRS